MPTQQMSLAELTAFLGIAPHREDDVRTLATSMGFQKEHDGRGLHRDQNGLWWISKKDAISFRKAQRDYLDRQKKKVGWPGV